MSMPEVTTVKVCSAFLVNFIMQSREAAQSNIVQMYGESLVLRVLLSLGKNNLIDALISKKF